MFLYAKNNNVVESLASNAYAQKALIIDVKIKDWQQLHSDLTIFKLFFKKKPLNNSDLFIYLPLKRTVHKWYL